MEALKDPLFCDLLMTLWLLPCAIQDWRTRRVSNWFTVPLFLGAWPVALLSGHMNLALATFLGTYLAWKLGAGVGGADGKIAVGLAAFAPPALVIGFMLQLAVFTVGRLSRKGNRSVPGVFWLWIGTCLALLLELSEIWVTGPRFYEGGL